MQGRSALARVLAISSYVGRGHIGLGAIVPALQALGHDVLGLPTVVLSNHPGHTHTGGGPVPIPALNDMVAAIANNGWLAGIDAVITGYLPTPGHVEAAAAAVVQLKLANPRALCLCDPVMGDDPDGLYVDRTVARAIAKLLVPLADILTPNRFELACLADPAITGEAEALRALAMLGRTEMVATSIPGNGLTVANVMLANGIAASTRVRRRPNAPHGTGDLLAALYLGHRLLGRDACSALGVATAGVEIVLEASTGGDELRLAGNSSTWSQPIAWPCGPVPT